MANRMLAIAALLILAPALAHAAPGSVEVDLDGTITTVEYDAEGIIVKEISASEAEAALIILVEVSGTPGVLQMTFEREFFDSVYDGTDEEFIIIADGIEPDSIETNTTDQSRTISVELEAGTEEVEIFGSILGGNDITEPPEEVPEVAEEEAIEEEPEAVDETDEEAESDDTVDRCGEGTILKDGICVLEGATDGDAMDKCGVGTILKDGICVRDEGAAAQSVKKPTGNFRDLIVGAGVALVISLVAIIIFWAIGRASRGKTNSLPGA